VSLTRRRQFEEAASDIEVVNDSRMAAAAALLPSAVEPSRKQTSLRADAEWRRIGSENARYIRSTRVLESRVSLPEHLQLYSELPSDVVFLFAARIVPRLWRQPSVIYEPKFHDDASVEASATELAFAVRNAAAAAFEQDALPGAAENDTLSRHSFEEGQLSFADLIVVRRELVDTRLEYLDRLLEAAEAAVERDAAAGVLQ
jgi:hypothetical protein